MNNTPALFRAVTVPPYPANSVSSLIKGYGGCLCTSSARLVVESWDKRDKKPMDIHIYSGFGTVFDIKKFARGFDQPDAPRFRQITATELLTLGAQEEGLGLGAGGNDWVYALGSATVHLGDDIACRMVDPTCYYPGLESLDRNKCMVSRYIQGGGMKSHLIALAKIS